jgi:hypothetical protein
VTLLDYVFLAVAGVGMVVLLMLFLARRNRVRRRGIPVVDLEARAEEAERRAEQAEATVKAGLLPHLARLLRSKMVTGLLSQRRHLVKSHREGAERAEALEERLASAQADLQKRLRGYEDRLQESVQKPKAADGKGSVQDASSQAAAPARRNPLIQRHVKPPPAAVKFAELLSRKQSPNSSLADDSNKHPQHGEG